MLRCTKSDNWNCNFVVQHSQGRHCKLGIRQQIIQYDMKTELLQKSHEKKAKQNKTIIGDGNKLLSLETKNQMLFHSRKWQSSCYYLLHYIFCLRCHELTTASKLILHETLCVCMTSVWHLSCNFNYTTSRHWYKDPVSFQLKQNTEW